jgi:serine/threonine-protein kinase HipA
MNSRYEQAILKTFEISPIQTVAELTNTTGIQKRTLQRYLKLLVEEGKVSKRGSARAIYYERVYNKDFAPSSIVVILNGDLVGILEYGHGQYLFAYDEKYKGKALPGLPKNEQTKSPELFAIFENLIPEHNRREKILLHKKDIADVLLELDNAHGAFDFVKLEELFKYKSKYSDRPSYSSIKAKVLGHNTYPNVLEMEIAIDNDKLKNSTSTELSNLSGYQHKIDITIDWDKNVISEAWESDYLLKPMNRELSDYFHGDEVMQGGKKRYYPLLALNEHLFMSFAKNELGFDVPYSGIVSTNYDFHYIVKRYDRYNEFKYNHFDLGQLLGTQSRHKYDVSSEELFEKTSVYSKSSKTSMCYRLSTMSSLSVFTMEKRMTLDYLLLIRRKNPSTLE